jgi:hypothetical protein
MDRNQIAIAKLTNQLIDHYSFCVENQYSLSSIPPVVRQLVEQLFVLWDDISIQSHQLSDTSCCPGIFRRRATHAAVIARRTEPEPLNDLLAL